MALRFIFNDAGVAADSIATPNGASSADTNFATTKIMAGPRSTGWRSTSTTASSVGYVYDEDVAVSHVVVARADWLLTKSGQQVQGRQRSSGGTWSTISGFNFNPLTAASLVGPRSQDLVVACAPTQLRGVGILCGAVSGSEASQVSKIYAGNAFSFSTPPAIDLNWQELPPLTYEKPMRGTIAYEVERRFPLTFEDVSQSEVTSFLAKNNLLHWPFFVYDDTGDVWDWRLEHVLLTDFSYQYSERDIYTVNLSLARLRHYD